MSEMLPKGWVEISLKDVVTYKKGKKPKNTIPKEKEGYIPYLLIDEMEGKPIRNYTNDDNIPTAQKNDVLIVWDGSIGKTATGLYGAIGSTIAALSPVIIPANFLKYFLKTAKPYIEQTSRGTGLQHINPKTFWPMPFPLPTLNEQKRIVAKLDAIMPRIESVKERLDKVPGILKRFRQSVLSSAVTGKLTGSVGYETTSFGDLIVSIRGGTTTPPRKEISKYPVLRSSSVRQGFIDYNDVFYLTKEQSTRQANFIQNGDILFTRLNGSAEFVGNCAVVKGVKEYFIQYPDRLYCAKLTIEILPEYCEIAFADPFLRLEIENRAKSSAGHKRISISDVKEMMIPLPSLEEQKEIVRQVEKLFALADKVEDHYKKAKAKLDNLSQSVLAKAFRGELVPQDPNDEPAEKLLERIMEEKAKMESALKAVKKKVPQKRNGNKHSRSGN